MGVRKGGEGQSTYLTADWGRSVKDNDIQRYYREGSHTRKGVNLPKGGTQSVVLSPTGAMELK
jgi:hypothetical protein